MKNQVCHDDGARPEVAAAAHVSSAAVERRRGTGTVLLVEDEAMIRRVVKQSLELQGYQVLAVENGNEAVAMCERLDQAIDLLVTDVVMPIMSGSQLVQRIAPLRPGLRVLYVSGYTDHALIHQGQRAPGTAFLQKLFTPSVLAQKVREVLDSRLREAA